MPLTDMGTRNAKWGVCGFCGALYALYAHSPALKHSDLTTLGTSDTKFLKEVKSYLESLLSKPALKSGIEKFCRSFDGYGGFTIPMYLWKARDAISGNPSSISEDFSIGLPPDAVVEYMRTKCGFRSARVVAQAASRTEAVSYTMEMGKDYVIGTRTDGSTMTMFGGLDHYIYRGLDGRIHSWGEVFSDLDDLNTQKSEVNEMCVIISVMG